MEKIFTQLYNYLHSASYKNNEPLKNFLFSTKQNVILVFYVTSQKNKQATLEEICYNISPKVISRSTIQNILKEGCKINFFEKQINENDKREKFYKLTNASNKLMQEWAFNQRTIFSNINDLVK